MCRDLRTLLDFLRSRHLGFEHSLKSCSLFFGEFVIDLRLGNYHVGLFQDLPESCFEVEGWLGAHRTRYSTGNVSTAQGRHG